MAKDHSTQNHRKMTDDRWNLKGSDEEVIKHFRETKREYDEQRDERVTNDRALELLMDGVPIERDSDTKEILERLERLDSAVADKVIDRLQEARH